MPIMKIAKGLPSARLPAEGLMYHDKSCLTPCQRDCIKRLGMTIQMEQETYMSCHTESESDTDRKASPFLPVIRSPGLRMYRPEHLHHLPIADGHAHDAIGYCRLLSAAINVTAMQELFLGKMALTRKRKDILKEAREFFTEPVEELDCEVRQRLGIRKNEPYVKDDKPKYEIKDRDLIKDIKNLVLKHYPPEPWTIETPYHSQTNTPSSSFLSLITSDTTVVTPEPIPTPSPTVSQVFFNLVSNTIDKAVFLHVDDRLLRYDTAYVMLKERIEEAMEIPVIDIKEDIGALFFNAYKMFEVNILEKERIATEIAWERRMRKKLKRTLRRSANFKGYESPPTPKSEVSSHESYKRPPPRPCICHPQFHYNRYPKDRFGIYLPRETKYPKHNVTVTPAISLEDLVGGAPDDAADTKSVVSGKSVVSTKSAVSRK